MDTVWLCAFGFFFLGAVGVVVEHLSIHKWMKDKLMLLIGALMALTVIVGVIAFLF